MRYRFCKRMRLATDRVRFYGLDGVYGYRTLNRYLTKPHEVTFTQHTCALNAEERLLRAIFHEETPCCNFSTKTESIPALFVGATIRKA